MKLRCLQLSISILSVVFLISCKTAKQVSFVLHAPTLNADSSVYITGSHLELGNWNPGKVPMEYKGNQKWTFAFTLDASQNLEYKYTQGSWAVEGANASGFPLPNFSVAAKNNMQIRDTVLNWTNSTKINHNGQITGEVRYHNNISNFGLLPRNVIVWLPPGYDTTGQTKYPVLYMLDGQNIFDPATSTFGNDWQVDETCDSLIRNKLLEPLIVVGIYNTANRSLEYLPGDTAQLFMKLVVNNIKLLIDEQYHTKPDREFTSVGGSSAGGIMAFMLAWDYTNVFSKAICMSPAFKIDEIDFVSRVSGYTGNKKDLKIYIDNGGDKIDTMLQPGIDDMLNALHEKEYIQDTDYIWIKDAGASHSEIDWAKRFPQAIQFIYNK